MKFSVPLTYAILIMQYNKRDIEKFIKVIPISGIVMVCICLIAYFIPQIQNCFYLENGRTIGFFQYSNTYAIFLLIGIISLLGYRNNRIKTYIGTAILLIGIYTTGSRIVFGLTILNFIIFIIKNKEMRKYLITLVIVSIIGTIAYVAITDNFNTIGRYLTTSINSSTLLGRLLYYKDAIPEILKNPFGMGYMGYSYIQGKIQTGVYNAVYIHNDFLQLALDIGIIPMLAFIVAIISSIFNKKEFDAKKQILLTITLHIMLDFDLQFLSIFLILVMTMDIFSGKIYKFNINGKILISTISIIIAIYLYFAVTTLMQYISKSEIAIKMYPIYTEANLEVMNKYAEDDIEYANEIASKILETNENSKSAYDIKSLYYLQNGSWRLMVKNKQESIGLSKYDIENYEEYILMLSGAINYYATIDDMKEAQKYINLVTEVPQKIEDLKNQTSSLSYKLNDKPNFELSENIQNYIKKNRRSGK